MPALVWAAGLGVRHAIGTSLLAIGAFGLTTAVSYGLAGSLDLRVAGFFVISGLAGGAFGAWASHRTRRETLRRAFAGVLVLVTAYMLYRNYAVLGA